MASEVTGVSSSPLSSSSAGSSSSASPPASANLAGVAGGGSLVGLQHGGHGGHQYQRRKQSRNFPGLVKRSHMGSLASIVAGSGGGQEASRRPSYGRSASVAASAASSRSRRPSSLHLPVTQTLSASSAMVSPILSVATRAINNNFMEAAELTKIGHSGPGSGSKSIPYPPLIFPAAEFAPGNHLPKQGHRLGPVPTKGNRWG